MNKIGILAWEESKETTLTQLECMIGNVMHSKTFSFELEVERVPKANYNTIITKPNDEVLNNMIKHASLLAKKGVSAIFTSCGFNISMQNQLASNVSIPVVSSSLVLLPFINIIHNKADILIVTADKEALTKDRFSNIGEFDNVTIVGIGNTTQFKNIRKDVNGDFNSDLFIEEVLYEIKNVMSDKIGAILLECTDLPPITPYIKKEFNVSVYDIVSLINFIKTTI